MPSPAVQGTPTTGNPIDAIDDYEQAMEQPRARFAQREVLRAIESREGSERLLHCLLIAFCTNGVGMTESVDGWIRRSGERCVALGFDELGEALQRHAVHEEGHHLMMINDAEQLVASWNQRHPDTIDREGFVGEPLGKGVDHYIAMHEAVIESSTPFAQVAIEYEIERLSITVGPRMITAVAMACGAALVQQLSFLNEHIEIDAGHTEFNRRQLRAFLSAYPDALGTLTRVGAQALDAYGEFLDDCWNWATERAAA